MDLGWVKHAREFQNGIGRVFGNRLYDEIDEEHLKSKVGIAIFGYKISEGCTQEQTKLIEELCKKIISLSKCYINIVYVMIKLKSNQEKRIEVLFRLSEKKNGEIQPPIFLDSAIRVYTSWKHYIQTNKLPKCNMCYPTNGVYEADKNGIFDIEFGESHACDPINSFLKITDFMSTASGLITTVIMGASVFTPIGVPVVIGGLTSRVAFGLYDVGRDIAKLNDMEEHGEDMESAEATMACWGLLLSAAGVASVGSSVALKTAQKVGVKRATGLLKVMKFLNISSLCLNGLSVVNGMYNIIFKCYHGTLETKDVSTFVFSCLFMFNAVISEVMADRMINEIVQNHISTLGNVIPMLNCTINPTIYVTNEFENYKILLSQIVGPVTLFLTSLDFHKIECNILNIRNMIMSVVNGEISLNKIISEIFETFHILIDLYRKACKISNDIYKIVFNSEFNLKNKNGQIVPRPLNIAILHDLSIKVNETAELLSFRQSEEVIKNRAITIMRLARDFDSLESAENLPEFFFKVGFFCEKLLKVFENEKAEYEGKLDIAKMEENFNESEFNCKYGIQSEGINEYFFLKTVRLTTKKLKSLNTNYKEQEKGSFKDDYFQDFKYESVFSFCSPRNVSSLTKKEYLSYATTFSEVEIDETTSEMFIDHYLVVIKPLPKKSVPTVLIYMPVNSEETYSVGIAVVLKNT